MFAWNKSRCTSVENPLNVFPLRRVLGRDVLHLSLVNLLVREPGVTNDLGVLLELLSLLLQRVRNPAPVKRKVLVLSRAQVWRGRDEGDMSGDRRL